MKYTLSEDELVSLSQLLLAEQPPTVSERFVGYMVEGTEEASNLARHVERVVFEERFELDDAKMTRLYGPYETSSTFFLVMDTQESRPAGVARVGRNGPAGLLTLNDAATMVGFSVEDFKAHYKVDSLDDVWDLGTTTVLKEYRAFDNHLVSQICYHCFWARAMHEGIKHYVTILDGDIRRTFALLGLPFAPFPGTGEVTHEGSTDSMFMYAPPADFPAGAAAGLERAKDKLKPFVASFKNRVFGPEIDHHLQFDITKCPGTLQKTPPPVARAALATSSDASQEAAEPGSGYGLLYWFGALKRQFSLF